MFHECNAPCGHKQHFSHAEKSGYEIIARVKAKTFSIKYRNQIIAGPFWSYQLEEKLNEHVK